MKKTPTRSLSYDRLTGLLTLVVGKDETSYWVEPIRHDDPAVRAFRVSKLRTSPPPAPLENYDVTVSPSGDSCECLGHLRWGHRTPCKHTAAVRVLIQRGAV